VPLLVITDPFLPLSTSLKYLNLLYMNIYHITLSLN
jgi:hypothetical protein